MPNLGLKPTHKPVRAYYDALAEYAQKGVVHEGAVQTAFQDLLVSCGRQFHWTLVPQYAVKRPKKQPIRIDGALVDGFNYTYAVLHHSHYCTRYAANLKRELPRIPFAPTFRPFATAGDRLAEIHIHYEQQPEYPLKQQENKDLPIDWRVEKMRLSKDKTQLKYNDFLTFTGIPPEAFEYRLGNRSALHWVIDRYQISTDKRSGITNDPNHLDDEEYIVRLIKQVITVSLETVQIVNDLPDLGLPSDEE